VTYRRVKNPKEIVVLFKTHLRDGADEEAYARTCERMHELVAHLPGFTSIRGYTSDDGDKVDIVRFESEEALKAWRSDPEHREAQRRGREEFYDRFSVQACRVFREYEFFTEDLEEMARSVQRRGEGAGRPGP
jgi:heme-degrading monooxygenase HmoA